MSARGTCPTCGRKITLTKAGLIRRHGSKDPTVWPPRDCPGWGESPTNID